MSTDAFPLPEHVTASLDALDRARPAAALVDPRTTPRGVRVWCPDPGAQQAAQTALGGLGYRTAVQARTGDLLVTGWHPDRLAARADQIEAAVRAAEYRHVHAADTTLSHIASTTAAANIDVDAGAGRELALRIVTDQDTAPHRRGQSPSPVRSAVTVTAADIDTAPGPVQSVLIRVAAAEQALRQLRTTHPADTAAAALQLYQHYRHLNHDPHYARQEAFADTTRHTRAVWDQARHTTTYEAEQRARTTLGDADGTLAALLADLDAAEPNPYPGDEAYQAQLAHGEGEPPKLTAPPGDLHQARDDHENPDTLPATQLTDAEAAAAPDAADAREHASTQNTGYRRGLDSGRATSQPAAGELPGNDARQVPTAQDDPGIQNAAPLTEEPPGKPVAADTVGSGDDRDDDSCLDALGGPAGRGSWVAGAPPDSSACVVLNSTAGAVQDARRVVAQTQTPEASDWVGPVSHWDAASQAGEALGDE